MRYRTTTTVLVAIGLVVMLAPHATAVPGAETSAPPFCADVTEYPIGHYYPQYEAGRLTIWLEDNGYDGLQRISCLDDGGEPVGKDKRLRHDPRGHVDPDDPVGSAVGYTLHMLGF